VVEVALVALQLALNIAVPAWLVRRDMRRLVPEQLARTWNDASLWSAVVAFGPLCLPFHFTKARRSLLGLALGLWWMLGSMVLVVLIGWAAEFALSGIQIELTRRPNQADPILVERWLMDPRSENGPRDSSSETLASCGASFGSSRVAAATRVLPTRAAKG
jgi:hypothetical protein